MAYLDVISLAEAKLYLRVDDTLTEDDAQITNMISSALKYVEKNTQILVFSRTKTYRMINGFVKVYDFPINSVITPLANVFATGTATCVSCIATDTLVLNGITYTGVAGTPTDFTEFSIDDSDTATAISLARAIEGDLRAGTLGDVSATSSSNVITLTTNEDGLAGNATTLAETGGTITLSGATFSGGVDGDLDADNIEEMTLYTNYCYGTVNRDLVLNIGYETAGDVPLDIVQVAYEVIDILYHGKETGRTMADISELSIDILNQNKRFVF